MELSEKTFAVLNALDKGKTSSQRQIARHAGISLGWVNYTLNSLLEKGLVKIDKLRKNPHKETYAYLLTPKGIQTKSALAVKFVLSKLDEYARIKDQLITRLTDLDHKGFKGILFVGPRPVKELMEQVIKESGLSISIKESFSHRDEILHQKLSPEDVILLSDGNIEGPAGLSRQNGIPRKQVFSVW